MSHLDHPAREALSEELRPVFDQLVEEYRFYALKHHGTKVASYKILADLIRAGWRPVGETSGEESST